MFKILKKYEYKNYDIFLVILIIAMGITGSIMVRSAAGNSSFLKQLIGFIIALILMIIISFIDYNFIGKFTILLYLFNIAILLLVKFAGVKFLGARRWFRIGSEPGGITIQPSELSKILIILCMAKYIDLFQKKINSLITLMVFCVTSAVPIALVMLQPDLSTSMIMLAIFAIILYVGGLSYKIILGVMAVGIPSVVLVIWYSIQPFQKLNILKDYQIKRIKGFLNPELYEESIQWQQINAKLAIGSGQLFGKGLTNNTITSEYISQSESDFIYAVVGEELGFVGASLILIVMAIVIIKCILIAKDAKNMFGRLIATGMATLLAIQTFVNVGVATGLMPNTGLPMPLISYGLSSLVSTMIGFGLVLNVSLQKRKN